MEEEERPDVDLRSAATTEEAFQEALREVVIGAEANGVDVRGSWPVLRGDETKLWDVEITRLSRSSTAHVHDTGAPVASIVDAVATRDGVEATDLPPLQEAVEYEVLEKLLAADDTQQHVQFQYCGYTITVRSDGAIRLEK